MRTERFKIGNDSKSSVSPKRDVSAPKYIGLIVYLNNPTLTRFFVGSKGARVPFCLLGQKKTPSKKQKLNLKLSETYQGTCNSLPQNLEILQIKRGCLRVER